MTKNPPFLKFLPATFFLYTTYVTFEMVSLLNMYKIQFISLNESFFVDDTHEAATEWVVIATDLLWVSTQCNNEMQQLICLVLLCETTFWLL